MHICSRFGVAQVRASSPRRWRMRSMLLGIVAAGLLHGAAGFAKGPAQAIVRLRIVGGLAGVNQYTRHEQPFWLRELPRLSGGRASADIVPFDRAGIRFGRLLDEIRVQIFPTAGVVRTLLGVRLHPLRDPRRRQGRDAADRRPGQ